MAFEQLARTGDSGAADSVSASGIQAGGLRHDHFDADSTKIVALMRSGSDADFKTMGFRKDNEILDLSSIAQLAQISEQTAQRNGNGGGRQEGVRMEVAQVGGGGGGRLLDRDGPAPLRPMEKQFNPLEGLRNLHKEMVNGAEKVFDRQGVPPEKAISDAVKNNAVTFMGEQHTLNETNPQRSMITKMMKEFPKGTRVAIEIPDVLKPVFDQFNKSEKGSDFVIPDKIDGKYGEQALELLRAIKDKSPDLIAAWKAARDAGVELVPIDNAAAVMPDADPKKGMDMASRDQHMKEKLKGLYNDDKEKPVVAWLGSLHCTVRGEKERKSAAQLLNEDPQFKKDGGKVTSFHSQIAEGIGIHMTLYPLSEKFQKPISAPTRDNGKANPLGIIPLFELPNAANVPLSDFDNVIVYPRAKAEAKLATEREPQLDFVTDDATLATQRAPQLDSVTEDVNKMRGKKVEASKRPESFTDETSTAAERSILNLDGKQIKEVKHEINQFGDVPEAALAAALKDNRVLATSTSMGDWQSHMNESLKLMQELKKNGATHAVFAEAKSLQPVLDEFNRTGKVDRKLLPPMAIDDYTAATMQAALNNGIKLVAGGASLLEMSNLQAVQMAATVKDVLKDKDAKVVVFGNRNSASSRPDNEGQVSMAQLLRQDGVSVKTAVIVHAGDITVAASLLAKGAKQPVAVPTAKAKQLAQVNAADDYSFTGKPKLGDYDIAVLRK